MDKKEPEKVKICLEAEIHDTALTFRESIADGTVNGKVWDVGLNIGGGGIVLNLRDPKDENKWKTIIIPAREYVKRMLEALGEKVDE